MLSKTRTILIFVSLVSFIYVLRGGDNSPVGFLARQAARILEERALTAKLCSGITMYESTTGEKSRADKISTALKKIRSGNPLVDFIEGSEDSSQFSKEYAVPLVAYAAPWIVFFAIGIVGCLGCAVNCCCMHYSCCGCIRACQKPKTTKYRSCFKNSSLVLMTLLVGTSIAGLIFSQDVRVGGQQTVCALGILVDNLLEGVEGGNWLGLNPILDNMTFLFKNNYITQNAVLMLPTYPLATTDKASILTTYNSATSSVTNMKNTNQGKTATRPDQSVASTYTPDYIAQITTNTGNIQTEIDTKYNTMSDGIDDITQGIAKINLVTYMTAVIQPYIMYQLDNAAGSAKNLSITMNDNAGTAKTAVKAIAGGLIGVFSVELISSVAAIAAIALVACGHKFFNKAIYGSCFCLSILMILGWVLSAVLFPTGVLLIEGCEVSEKFQTDAIFYNATFDKFLNNPNYTSVRNILYNCLFEDGDVLTEIDIRQYFGGHQQLFDGLEATYALTEVNGVTIDNSVVIPEQQTLVGNYKSGLVSDADATTTDLKKLNQYTNSGTYTCTSIDDTWILNSGLCKDMGTVFQSSSADDFNLNNPTCIGFDAWGSSHNINNRYTTTTYPTSCGQIDGGAASTTLENFVDNFVQSRSDVNTIFGNVQSSLSSVSTANGNFMTQVKSATTHIDASSGPRKTVAPVYAKLGDPTTGVLPNGNCKWVKASLGTFQDVMCNRFITGIFQSTIVIIIASFLALFGTMTLFCLAKRFLVKEGQKGQYNHVTLNSPSSKYTVNT